MITQNSGAPGGGMQVQLRGTTSINANSSPLYVIDGILVSNASISNGLNSITAAGGGITNSQDQPVNRIADLNPADIENIEVLKGASAGADLRVARVERRDHHHDAPRQPGPADGQLHATGRSVQHLEQARPALLREHSGGHVRVRCGDCRGYTAAGGACHDFEEQFYSGNPMSYETDASIRGGSGGTTYYIGGLAKRDNAIQRNSYYQKQSMTANISQTLGNHVTVRANNEFVHSLTDRGISGNDNADIVSPGDIFSSTPTWSIPRPGSRTRGSRRARIRSRTPTSSSRPKTSTATSVA